MLVYARSRVIDDPHEESLVDRLSRQGEDALGKVAEELAKSPVVAAALARAFEARDRAAQAQEAAMGALGVPSAADLERLTRRVRSVSQRLEGIEESLDRLDARLDVLLESDARSGRLEARLDQIGADLAVILEAVGPRPEPPHRAQERLTVSEH